MTTPLQALHKAMKESRNATEVLARLSDQGFTILHVEGTIAAATTVLSFHPGITQPEAVARTVVMGSILGATMDGMLSDG